jgi:hypothetical protein
MENIKQYLPWIIGAVVLIYVLRKLTTKTSFLPQTQLIQTPQTDPYAESRSKAFELLTGLGISQTQADVERSRISEASALERLRIGAERDVNLSAIEFQNRLANLNILQRDQDRQLQQSAIDRYYSSRNNQAIFGSINQALNSIFRNRNGNIFGTPKTFPSSSFEFGGF